MKLRLKKEKTKIYTFIKRQDRPDAILWLCKNASELTDGQISKLVGSTKGSFINKKKKLLELPNLKPRVSYSSSVTMTLSKVWKKLKEELKEKKKLR